jgi:hypothetical protein
MSVSNTLSTDIYNFKYEFNGLNQIFILKDNNRH